MKRLKVFETPKDGEKILEKDDSYIWPIISISVIVSAVISLPNIGIHLFVIEMPAMFILTYLFTYCIYKFFKNDYLGDIYYFDDRLVCETFIVDGGKIDFDNIETFILHSNRKVIIIIKFISFSQRMKISSRYKDLGHELVQFLNDKIKSSN